MNNKMEVYDKFGSQLVSKQFVLDQKKSDTVIIFGSGPSINKLNDEVWEKLNKDCWDSIAINWWVYHWYVPTFWFMELIYTNKRHTDIWIDLIKSRESIGCYDNVIWFHVINRWLYDVSLDEFNSYYPRRFKKFLYHRLFYEDWFEKIEKIFHDCKKHQSIDRCWGPSRNTSSVVCAIFFAYIMNYERIILAGIDLDTSNYYWTDYDVPVHRRTCYGDDIDSNKNESYISENNNILIYKRDGNLIKTFSNVSTSDTIIAIKNLFDKEGIQLVTANKGGKLYPSLEYFQCEV